MPQPDVSTRIPLDRFEPGRPDLVAVVVFLLAALSLCWPMLAGQFLASHYSDQFEAGYSFRHFAAQYFREHRAIPLWNPFLFAGLPFVGGMHGDIFYPTAWLRWVLPTDVAMNLGFATHLVLAGVTMYALLRAIRVAWVGALVGGLAYELSGIVASQVHPGHDGKLFVSALAPLLLLGVLRAVRDRAVIGYAWIALATGLSLHGHPQMSYYLLVAAGVWGALLLFSREGPTGAGARLRVGAAAGAAVALGFGVYAIQALPFYEYIPYSPRAAGGDSTGWEYATAFSLPLAELVDIVLPEFTGMASPTYFGPNGIKLHTEYLGPVVLLLALAGVGGDPDRRVIRRALGVVGLLALLISLGRYTPFYRIWYEAMPLMKKVRAPGMAFFLATLPIAALAGFGAERLCARAVPLRRLGIGAGVIGLIAVLAATGLLQGVTEDLARGSGSDVLIQLAIRNAPDLRLGGVRLLIALLVAVALFWAIQRGRVAGLVAPALLGLTIVGDLYSVDRRFFAFSPGATITYAADPAMLRMRETPYPYRAWAPSGVYGQLNPYPRSWLMAGGIPTLFGYHGNELRFFDDLLGGKNAWRNQVNPALLRMFAIRFAVLSQPLEVPGFHQILGPATTTLGDSVWLYEADTPPPYAWVVPAAAKVPEDQVVATVNDPRFPADRLVLFSDTTSVVPAALDGALPEPPGVSAPVVEWRAGRMRIRIEGETSDGAHLVVAENWYKDWHALVDGTPAPVHRGNHTLLTVPLPPGAREVVLEFDSAAYRQGRLITILATVLLGLLFAFARARRGRPFPLDAPRPA